LVSHGFSPTRAIGPRRPSRQALVLVRRLVFENLGIRDGDATRSPVNPTAAYPGRSA
jgi:hypothetical protein